MKNQYRRLALGWLILLSLTYNVTAQTNLALTAVASAYTPDPSGLYNWSTINDNNFGTCGSQQAFIWTSNTGLTGTEYMAWTWTGVKTLNKIVIHHGESANRSLTGALIQYWNGTTWVNVQTITLPQQCINTVSFTTVSTTALRLTDFKAAGTGQQSNMNYREIELYGPNVNNDATVSFLTTPNICSYTQPIIARVANVGKKNLDSFRLYWSVQGVQQGVKYIPCNIPTGKDTSITLFSSYSFTQNTTYTFKAWTLLPNGTQDSTPSNDDMTTVVNFLGNPTPPTTANFVQCGNGKPLLKGVPASPVDSISWYDAATGGNYLGLGRSVLGPFITQSKTFYAQAMKFGSKGNNLLLTNAGGFVISNNVAGYNGAMFNITVANSVKLDSITFRLRDNNPTTYFFLYFKTGTHVGFQTNASAWTLLNGGLARKMVVNGMYFARVSTKDLILVSGQTYGFYYTTDPASGGGNDIFITSGALSNTNNEVTLSGFSAIYGLFGTAGLFTNYTANVELMYTKICTNPIRTPLLVTVKPRPTGADIVKGSTFVGQFKAGTPNAPDVAEAGKTIMYNMVPPTGETNANHNSSWIVNGVTGKTKFGKSLTSGTDFQWSLPSSGGPGIITFTPKSIYIDSLITFAINYSDLGPYFCDSTVSRTVMVAPTPWTNFKFPTSVCLGDIILFDNLTTIKSGNATYMWYFGNGDSSDLQSPTYEYKSPGTYNVRLRAKSFPWNVLHDTIIQLEVGELPTTMFRVNNKCQGLPVTFQNQTVVANGVLTYDWDFGDGSAHSTAINPSHLYSTPDGYKVTLKATANGCVSTLVKNAYMFARPVANFGAPIAPICAKSEVFMPNSSTIALGSQGAYWTFGDGASSTQYDGQHPYTTPGTYAVKLLAVSEFDCKDSITKSVTIKPTPNPDFVGNQFCAKIPTIFTNKTTEALPNPVYIWTFSDNFTSSLKNVTRTWPYEGPFSVMLKASYSNGCSSFITKDFTVLMQPKADFTVQNICSGETANFVNNSKGDRSGIQYNWDFGNSTTSTLLAPTRLYNPSTTTTYTVTLVASYPGACSDTIRKTITVSESPLCDFTFKDLGLKKLAFTPANSNYVKYEWFFGEGGTSTSTAPNYQYAYTGNFNVTLRATNLAGCTCEMTKKASATTGISLLSNANGVSVYPNPNNGTFTISNADDKGMKVEIFNVLGSRIYSKTSSEGTMLVNLDEHAKGIYLVKVTIDGVTTTTKITLTN